MAAAADGLTAASLATRDQSVAQKLRSWRLLLDRAALDEIGALTLGTLDLEVAGACNAECVFCPREPLRAGRGVGIMRSETFAALVERLAPYLRFVGFAGVGEPTLNARLPDFIRVLSDRRIQTALVTNGSLLTDELIETLLTAGIGSIQVSFNGLDRASYEAHMIGLEFTRTLGRVERLAEVARDRVPIYISAVETTQNHEQLAGFVEYWQARGVAATIVPCHSRGGTVLQLGARRSVERVVAPRCGLFASRAFVAWDGRVLACCHDVDGQSELGRVTIDDAESIIMRKLEVMRTRSWFPICDGCDEPARLHPVTFPSTS